jgi:hypothetical protein
LAGGGSGGGWKGCRHVTKIAEVLLLGGRGLEERGLVMGLLSPGSITTRRTGGLEWKGGGVGGGVDGGDCLHGRGVDAGGRWAV